MNTADELLTSGSRVIIGTGLASAAEDCLKMIFLNSKITGYTRINFLAARLNVSPACASGTVRRLKEMGLVEFEKYGMISLTQEGRELGRYLSSF
jgi:DtxR family Mn-dependent transcriptional regulator